MERRRLAWRNASFSSQCVQFYLRARICSILIFNNWKAIEENGGWIVGRELFVDRWYITGVHKKREVIYEYCIQKNGHDIWLPKSEAISMAVSYQLHAIVVHMKNGSCYLRPEYHAPSFCSLIL